MEMRDAISLRVYDYRLRFTMGVDYSAVGGVGIGEDKFLKPFIAAGKFTEEEYEEGKSDCMGKCGFLFSEAGNFYGEADERECFLLVPGKNLAELLENAPSFIESLKPFGIELTFADLMVLEEAIIW